MDGGIWAFQNNKKYKINKYVITNSMYKTKYFKSIWGTKNCLIYTVKGVTVFISNLHQSTVIRVVNI